MDGATQITNRILDSVPDIADKIQPVCGITREKIIADGIIGLVIFMIYTII